MTIKELKEFIYINKDLKKEVLICNIKEAKIIYEYKSYENFIKDDNINNLKLNIECYPLAITKKAIYIWIE